MSSAAWACCTGHNSGPHLGFLALSSRRVSLRDHGARGQGQGHVQPQPLKPWVSMLRLVIWPDDFAHRGFPLENFTVLSYRWISVGTFSIFQRELHSYQTVWKRIQSQSLFFQVESWSLRHICPLILIYQLCLWRECWDGAEREEPLWDLKRVLVRGCSMLRGESKKVCSQGSMFIQREESWQILGPLASVPTTSAVLIPTSIPKSTPKRVCSDFCGLHRIIVNDEYTSRSVWFLFKKSAILYTFSSLKSSISWTSLWFKQLYLGLILSFLPRLLACGIWIPWPGIEPIPRCSGSM